MVLNLSFLGLFGPKNSELTCLLVELADWRCAMVRVKFLALGLV